MDPKGSAWPSEGTGPRQTDQTDGCGVFDSRGLIYTHIIPRGASINAAYTIKVLGTFLEHFKK